MSNITYPPKPWRDGQTAELMKGMRFAYSASMKKWVPITPGYQSSKQLEEAFGVETVEELNTKLTEIDTVTAEITTKAAALETKAEVLETKTTALETKTVALDSDIKLSGRIWKSTNKPPAPADNDVWMDAASGKTFNYDATYDTWVEN